MYKYTCSNKIELLYSLFDFCIHSCIPLSTLFLSSCSFFLPLFRVSPLSFFPFLFFLFLFFLLFFLNHFCQLAIYFLIFNSRLAQRLLVYVFCFFPLCFKCSKPKHNTLSKLVCSSITLHFE